LDFDSSAGLATGATGAG